MPDNVHLRKDSEINLMEVMESLAPVTDESEASFKPKGEGVERFRRRVEPSNTATGLPITTAESADKLDLNDIAGTPPSGDGEFDSGSGSTQEVKRNEIVGETNPAPAVPVKVESAVATQKTQSADSSAANVQVSAPAKTAAEPVSEGLKADEAAFIAGLHKAAEQKKNATSIKKLKLPGSMGEDDEMNEEISEEDESTMKDNDPMSAAESTSSSDEEVMPGDDSEASAKSEVTHPSGSGAEEDAESSSGSGDEASASGSSIAAKKDVVQLESGNGVTFVSGAGDATQETAASGESDSEEESLPGNVGAVKNQADLATGANVNSGSGGVSSGSFGLVKDQNKPDLAAYQEKASGSGIQEDKLIQDLAGTSVPAEPQPVAASASGSTLQTDAVSSDESAAQVAATKPETISGESNDDEETLPGSEGALSTPAEEENLMSLNTPAVQQNSASGQAATQESEESGSGIQADAAATHPEVTTSKDDTEESLPGGVGAIADPTSLETASGSGTERQSAATAATQNEVTSSGSGATTVEQTAKSAIAGEPSDANGIEESGALTSASGSKADQSVSLKGESSENQLLPGNVGAADGANLMSLNTPNVDVSGSGQQEDQATAPSEAKEESGSASGESVVTVGPSTAATKKDNVPETSGESASGQEATLNKLFNEGSGLLANLKEDKLPGAVGADNLMKLTNSGADTSSTAESGSSDQIDSVPSSGEAESASGEADSSAEQTGQGPTIEAMSGFGQNLINTDVQATKKNIMPTPEKLPSAPAKEIAASAELDASSASGSGEVLNTLEEAKTAHNLPTTRPLPGSDGKDDSISSSGSGDLSSALESAMDGASGMDFFQNEKTNEMLPEVKKTTTEKMKDSITGTSAEEMGGDESGGSVSADSMSSSSEDEEEMKSTEELNDKLEKTTTSKAKDETQTDAQSTKATKEENKEVKSESSTLADHPGLAAALSSGALGHIPIALGSSGNTYGFGSGAGIDFGSVGDVISGAASGMGTLELTPAKDPSEVVMKLFGSASGSDSSAEGDHEKQEDTSGSTSGSSKHGIPIHHHKKGKVSDKEKEEKKKEEVCFLINLIIWYIVKLRVYI